MGSEEVRHSYPKANTTHVPQKCVMCGKELVGATIFYRSDIGVMGNIETMDGPLCYDCLRLSSTSTNKGVS